MNSSVASYVVVSAVVSSSVVSYVVVTVVVVSYILVSAGGAVCCGECWLSVGCVVCCGECLSCYRGGAAVLSCSLLSGRQERVLRRRLRRRQCTGSRGTQRRVLRGRQ